MAGIKKISAIKKRIFKFDTRKKYYNKKRFKIKEIRPLDVLVNELKETLWSEDKEKREKLKKPIVFVFMVAFVLAGVIGYDMFFGGGESVIELPEISMMPSLFAAVKGSGIASFGPHSIASHNVAYYILEYGSSGAENVQVVTESYDRLPPNQVFILESKREQSESYPQFFHDLKKKLKENGILVNSISLEQVENLPSGCILIVPSGYLPQKLANDGPENIISIAERGVSVIYIGYSFNYVITENGDKLLMTSNVTKGLVFQSANLKATDGFKASQAGLYTVKASKDQNPLMLYGIVSVVNIGDGAILFIPQVLDSGWESYESAADDLEMMVTQMLWNPPKARKTFNLNPAPGGNQEVLFSVPFAENEKNLLIRVIAKNGTAQQEKIIAAYPRPDVNGGLFYVNDITKTVPYNISGQSTNFLLVLNENNNESRFLYLSIKDAYGNEVSKSRVSRDKLALRGGIQFEDKIGINPEIYIANIVDEENNKYANAILQIVDINFQTVKEDYREGNFTFKVSAGGEDFYLKDVIVIVNGGEYGTYETSGSELSISLKDKIVGTNLPTGNYTFEFKVNQLTKKVVLENPESGRLSDNPLFWVAAFGILASLYFIAPYLARLTSTVDYSLDIPDFPPLMSIKIPIKKSAVLDVLEKVNEDYKWASTPLKLSEIKKGFGKIVYQSKPVFISDYNLEYILENLEGTGDVKKALNYYGLIRWEKKTGKSIKFLSIYRSIRDMCITEAVPFTSIGESKDCDIKLSVLGQNLFVYIVDSPKVWEEKIGLALQYMQKNPVVVLFENDEEKAEFEDMLNSTSESAAMVKLEVMNGSVNLLTIKELRKMIKEMKEI
ncbi:hypothetical protein KJ780_00465 [Candidatus Micrarchaeota archaeon]|nr:hypothetical protein [Candidatus Micrarchaeota archaeon]